MQEIRDKHNATRRRNHSFNTSRPEQEVYGLLLDIFGKNDVMPQYHDHRYPFLCDFYIRSRDLFIELNAFWSHGRHWFNPVDVRDIETLQEWRSKNSKYYDNAIATWTKCDVRKRNTARQNNLNYLVFWDNDLFDFYGWMIFGCPNGNDWDRMYSWRG